VHAEGVLGYLMDFDASFDRLIGHEGGYVNDPQDPGGETRYGVSKRQYPSEDIKSLTLARAKEIYRRDYWGPAGCDAVPEALKFDLFDTAVNAGVEQAILFLQRCVGEVDDGILGPRTLQAVQSMNPWRLFARFNGHRLDHLNDLKHWPRYGRGWAQRIAENLKAA
jgi:lysozyme family protein